MYKCLPAMTAMFAAGAILSSRTAPRPAQDLAPSKGFFLPGFLDPAASERPLARGKDLTISVRDHLSYLAARAGDGFVEAHVFAVLLARECEARGLAADAPAAARKAARHSERGHARGGTHVGRLNEALLRRRIDALVRAGREPSAVELRRLFDHTYGVDGHKVEVRQILIGLPATERRLAAAGKATGEAAIDDAAKARAKELHERLGRGTPFTALLQESDDPTTRSLLADPRFAARAGFVEGYNYQRYGVPFAEAVRGLEVGQVSTPVKTSHGYHLIQLMGRTTTRYDDVEAKLRELYVAQPVSAAEERALEEELFRKHRVEIVD